MHRYEQLLADLLAASNKVDLTPGMSVDEEDAAIDAEDDLINKVADFTRRSAELIEPAYDALMHACEVCKIADADMCYACPVLKSINDIRELLGEYGTSEKCGTPCLQKMGEILDEKKANGMVGIKF